MAQGPMGPKDEVTSLRYIVRDIVTYIKTTAKMKNQFSKRLEEGFAGSKSIIFISHLVH